MTYCHSLVVFSNLVRIVFANDYGSRCFKLWKHREKLINTFPTQQYNVMYITRHTSTRHSTAAQYNYVVLSCTCGDSGIFLLFSQRLSLLYRHIKNCNDIIMNIDGIFKFTKCDDIDCLPIFIEAHIIFARRP